MRSVLPKKRIGAARAEPAPLALPASPGFLIRILQTQMFQEFYRFFESAGVTPGMHTALLMIRDNDGVRQGALAQALLLRDSNMTRLINSLENNGLVERRVDPADRRSVGLHLTPAGTEFVAWMSEQSETLDERYLAPLTLAERRTLMSLLQRMSDHLGAASK